MGVYIFMFLIVLGVLVLANWGANQIKIVFKSLLELSVLIKTHVKITQVIDERIKVLEAARDLKASEVRGVDNG